MGRGLPLKSDSRHDDIDMSMKCYNCFDAKS